MTCFDFFTRRGNEGGTLPAVRRAFAWQQKCAPRELKGWPTNGRTTSPLFYSCSVEQVSPSFPYRFMRSSMFALDYSIVSRKGTSGTRWFQLKAAVMCKSSHCSQEWRRTASLISTLGASLTLVLYLKREQQLSWCSVFEYGVHLQLCRNICYFLSLCFPPALLWPDSEAIKTALC